MNAPAPVDTANATAVPSPDLTGPQVAAKFIADMFGATTDMPVHICRFANDRKDDLPFRRENTRETTVIERFVRRNDEPGRAVYFCVGTLKEGATTRNKQNIAEISFLWADVDFKDLDLKDVREARAYVERKLTNLIAPDGRPYPPSCTVFTGHGIHCYWLLSESVDAQAPGMMERIENDLRLLCDLVGGDLQVCEIARLMRLPGSHNSKFEGELIPVEVLTFNGNRYELDDLEEMLSEASPIILRKSRPPAVTPGENNAYLAYARESGIKSPVDVEARLKGMMYMGGEVAGIHSTQLSVTSSMIKNGHQIEAVVERVLEATKAAAGDYGKRWNWDKERRTIRNMCETALVKYPPRADRTVVPGTEIVKITDAQNPKPASLGLAMTLFDDVENYTKKSWLMKGVIAKGETSMWVAPPKKLKSALLTDIAIHLASGTDWRGYRSKEECGVVYFAFERADLVKRRLAAHRKREELTGLPIATVGRIINLMHPECVEVIVATIRDAEKSFGRSVGFAIFDTLAKGIAAGSGDENQAKDLGAALANLRRVQEMTGAHIAIIHHTGKDETKGPRGSNSQVGDVDVLVQLSGDAIKVATVTGANDQAEGELTRFEGEIVVLGVDEDGDEISTMIISADDCGVAWGRSETKVKLSNTEQRAMQMLYNALNDSGKDAPSTGEFPNRVKVVPVDTWRTYCKRGGISSGESDGAFRQAFRRVLMSLTAKYRIGVWNDLVWVAYD